MSLLLLLSAAVVAPPPPAWMPTDLMLRSIVQSVEPTLQALDQATGRFGTQPWICNDQNVLYPLAVAWAWEHPDNPWYQSAELLTAIAKGGEALVDDQDETGRWIFRKKDNSTWGMIHMPWTYSRWVRAFQLVQHALPEENRAKQAAGLRLGFTGIAKYMSGSVHNIPCHHAMGLYIAGQVFDEPAWREAAAGMMHRVVEKQDPAGFWSENHGPVVGYNRVYVEALGVYYAASGDEAVLPALERSARFHAAVLWANGSAVSAIDERQLYSTSRDAGNIGFSFSPAGRGYLLAQLDGFIRNAEARVNADYAANFVLYAGDGPVEPLPAAQAKARNVVGDNGAVIERDRPWQWCFSAYTCPVPTSRWIQDRHNLVDVFHDRLGLIVGGGNTKLQPYWSTFAVGDPALLPMPVGVERPAFRPAIDLLWVPTAAELDLPADAPPTLRATYGPVTGTVTAAPQPDGSMALTYAASGDLTKPVAGHVPLRYRGAALTTGAGQRLRLGDQPLVLTAEEAGGSILYDGLRVELPAGSSLRWPEKQHNPYHKTGESGVSAWKLVVVLPLSVATPSQTVVLRHEPAQPFDGLAFQALDLPVESPTGTDLKRLEDLGSMFLRGAKPGDQMVFALPPVPAGEYDLLADFVLAYSYGIVQVSLDGQPVGEPFDGYCEVVDAAGERVALGRVRLTDGEHKLAVTVVGKRPAATGSLISVKQWLLKPVE